ncbi:UNKNOWN [Stylonychia lemnae]|uniref:Uncharacterized protein n=1 Tax=Stylonychia lemnae TaxID=5949 RepID=A0A078B2M0_STYLE|nr:UNKNOWN [Stylonychia lemnae]|eukprot:CDW88729.1 UNKNOWN [Stylonychia lemnae]
MDILLKDCDLYHKYHQTFESQGITIERFEKLSKLNQTTFASAIMERCQMTCGDFIDLICSWESYVQSKEKRQNSDLNQKKARSITDSDEFKTPKSNSYRDCVSDFTKSDQKIESKIEQADKSTQTGNELLEVPLALSPQGKVSPSKMLGKKRTVSDREAMEPEKPPCSIPTIVCQNKRRAQQLLVPSQSPNKAIGSKVQTYNILEMPSKPQTPTFKESFNQVNVLLVKDNAPKVQQAERQQQQQRSIKNSSK